MSSTTTETNFSAFAAKDLTVVRVEGPGICRESGRFENLLLDVEHMDFHTLVLDLADCSRMDSTFAGALLRLAKRATDPETGRSRFRIVLAGARDQVAQLLDTLCLTQLFESVPIPNTDRLGQLDIEVRDLSKEEILALSLDGHERLSALNDDNARRFVTLLPILRSELHKGVGTSSPGP